VSAPVLITTSTQSTTPSSTSNTATTPCDYYASPNGGGDGRTSSTPFTIQNFWVVASAGKTLCLLDGIYQSAANMIQPPANLGGTSSAPITVQAVNDGQVTIDGQFANYPVHLSNNNNWWVLQGFNAKNGAGAVVRNNHSNNNVYRRIIAWDADIRLNSGVFYNITSTGTLCEDCAFFGTGAVLIEHGPHRTHRCHRRLERQPDLPPLLGPVGGKHDELVWEGRIRHGLRADTEWYLRNCLVTASGESMPAAFTVTDYSGGTTANPNCYPSSGTSTVVPCPESVYRIRAASTNPTLNAAPLGSLVYLRASDSWQGPQMVKMPTGGADASGIYVRSSMVYIDPSNGRFNNIMGFLLQQTTTNSASLISDKITSVRGATGDLFSSDWTVTNTSTGTSLGSVANPWAATGAGANLCYRWINQVPTTIPLWPWPMNDRIKAATAVAGAYAGPCLNCSGGRAARAATDVTSDIQNLLGTIPSQCRS
jgi:hypothetical protein